MTGPDKCDPNWDIRVNFEVFSKDMWNVKMNLKNWIKTLDSPIKGTNHVSYIRPSEFIFKLPIFSIFGISSRLRKKIS